MVSSAIKPIPEGMHALTPHIVCAGAAAAIEFYKQAFGAVETSRLPGPQGKLMHAEVRIDDSALMLTDEMPEWGSLGPKALKGSPVTIHLYVKDVDATVAQAAAAGAKITMPVADMFWGDRYGQLEDPFGHRWSVATHTRGHDARRNQAGDGADENVIDVRGGRPGPPRTFSDPNGQFDAMRRQARSHQSMLCSMLTAGTASTAGLGRADRRNETVDA